MDKKAKKRLQLLNQRVKKLQLQLAGARQQPDDTTTLAELEKEMADTRAEIEKLKKS